MLYNFRCSCGFTWQKNVLDSSRAGAVRCPRADRPLYGTAAAAAAAVAAVAPSTSAASPVAPPAHVVTARRRRDDARRPPRVLDADQSLALTRPLRTTAGKRAAEFDLRRPSAPSTRTDDSDDEGDMVVDDPRDDATWLPAAQFNPAMRYSAGGTFALGRVIPGPTTLAGPAFTGIRPAAARSATQSVFGMSAPDYGRRESPGLRVEWEWCHLIAVCLGGATDRTNLVCATNHANTAMLVIEHLLMGHSELEVCVQATLRRGTMLAEAIHYRIRHAASGIEFVENIDGLATGCTAREAEELRDRVRTFLARALGRRIRRAARLAV